ncbi:MAG: DNA mismatch repair endonuclease MutL [Desulfuromonadaceae bacterium]|nr:DNA mismatch repair endonuclease MutL [Desulfuromonadaceae bacterium]
MSHRIIILPETLTNKIAAGEVVERPSSVIKELIENSLDAGATDISVEITDGGRRLIRLADNGHGMSREDALLSLERHATSKIRNEEDLDGILTLGFRGEALPSIASVSRFRLATREPGSLEGTEIMVEGGRVRDVKACGMAPGTVISVEQIFFNIPARLKFMKSAETEAGHVADLVGRMAVSRPAVAFSYRSDGRDILKVQRSDLQRRLSQVAGKNTSAELHQVCYDDNYVSVSGFVSGPSLVRSSLQGMYTYINGRYVRDKLVQHAVMQAYRGVIDRVRYPVVALFIQILPGDVDVNVHPTKHEVRFRRQSAVHDAIQAAVEGVLRGSPWLVNKTAEPLPSKIQTGEAYRERIAAAAQASLSMPRREEHGNSYTFPAAESNKAEAAMFLSQTGDELPTVSEPTTHFTAHNADSECAGYFSSLAIIGQFHSEYILCQSGSELMIIDQHAASERVLFQRLKQQFLAGKVESQRLLFPDTVELSFSEVAVASHFLTELAGIGFELEPFGGNTLMVAAVPRLVAEKNAISLLRDILADLVELGISAAFQDVLDELLSRIACHSVVRGAHPLEACQIGELLRSMDETDFSASCPHGRPVSHVIRLAELEKIFKRT